jgi:hypothetical protein
MSRVYEDARATTLWPILTDRTRLDAMHQGIKTYLDGKFYLAPLESPQTILDIGYEFCIT